ncbi:hypothetical protein, partial [Aquitalea sp. ASV11]|uniref:hypothetical protein n=1 Tax=Aquitalea sp. ASV11 TaxID=2795103 RepID=UPI001E361F96
MKPEFHKVLPFSDLARSGAEFWQILQISSHKVLTRVGQGGIVRLLSRQRSDGNETQRPAPLFKKQN